MNETSCYQILSAGPSFVYFLGKQEIDRFSLEKQRSIEKCFLDEQEIENYLLGEAGRWYCIIQNMKLNTDAKQGASLRSGAYKLGAKDLRHTRPTPDTFKTIKRNPIYLVLDRIIDTYNIGSLFRLADAIAAEKMFICGDTEYPPSSRIHKAAVGTEEWVPWQKADSTVSIVKKLKSEGVQIVCVEQDLRSIPFSLLGMHAEFPVAIVIGNETEGISKDVLDAADVIVELPMFGVNKSFNVWGSAAVVAYKVIESLIWHPYRLRKKVL